MHLLVKPNIAIKNVVVSLRSAAATTTAKYRQTRQAWQVTKSVSQLTAIQSFSTMHDNDPNVLDREKRRNLNNIQHKTSTPHDYAPGWNEYIATASEASVKADISANHSDDSIDDLQRKTIKHIQARHADDNNGSREAGYSHDSVEGPLGGAIGSDDIIHFEESIVTEEITHKDTKKARIGGDKASKHRKTESQN